MPRQLQYLLLVTVTAILASLMKWAVNYIPKVINNPSRQGMNKQGKDLLACRRVITILTISMASVTSVSRLVWMTKNMTTLRRVCSWSWSFSTSSSHHNTLSIVTFFSTYYGCCIHASTSPHCILWFSSVNSSRSAPCERHDCASLSLVYWWWCRSLSAAYLAQLYLSFVECFTCIRASFRRRVMWRLNVWPSLPSANVCFFLTDIAYDSYFSYH